MGLFARLVSLMGSRVSKKKTVTKTTMNPLHTKKKAATPKKTTKSATSSKKKSATKKSATKKPKATATTATKATATKNKATASTKRRRSLRPHRGASPRK